MNKAARALLPLAGVFLFLSLSVFFFSKQLISAGFDTNVLLVANVLLLAISFLSFFIQFRGIGNTNPHVFVRSVMAGMMMKMLVCLAVTFAYVYLSGSGYNKKSVFVALLLYLVYLALEVYAVMTLNKKKNA